MNSGNKFSRNIILRFNSDIVDQPIVYMLVKEYNLIPNIIKAHINPEKEGYLLLNISGQEKNYRQALKHLETSGLTVQQLSDHVSWDQDLCTQCGQCTGLCPSGALTLKRPEQQIIFDSEKCIVCNMCIQICPVKAVALDI